MNDYKTEITSKYSREYLNKFIKVLFADNLTLKFNETYPLLIEQKTDLININFLLAPRVGQDE